jgi:hypothetical protein
MRDANLEDPAGAVELHPFFLQGFVEVVDGHNPEFIVDHGFFQILAHLLKSFGGFHLE